MQLDRNKFIVTLLLAADSLICGLFIYTMPMGCTRCEPRRAMILPHDVDDASGWEIKGMVGTPGLDKRAILNDTVD